MTNLHQHYTQFLNHIYPPLVPDDGVRQEDIVAAEQRLGFLLPPALRVLYHIAGHRQDITASHNRLTPTTKLTCRDQMLVFLVENQAVMLWGVHVQDISEADPIVYMAENAPSLVWRSSDDPLSVFLIAMLTWQATMGGLAYCGIGAITGEVPQTAFDDWEVLAGSHSVADSQIYIRAGQVVCLEPRVGGATLSAGTRTRAAFVALTETLHVTWDYSTLDEEVDDAVT